MRPIPKHTPPVLGFRQRNVCVSDILFNDVAHIEGDVLGFRYVSPGNHITVFGRRCFDLEIGCNKDLVHKLHNYGSFSNLKRFGELYVQGGPFGAWIAQSSPSIDEPCDDRSMQTPNDPPWTQSTTLATCRGLICNILWLWKKVHEQHPLWCGPISSLKLRTFQPIRSVLCNTRRQLPRKWAALVEVTTTRKKSGILLFRRRSTQPQSHAPPTDAPDRRRRRHARGAARPDRSCDGTCVSLSPLLSSHALS